MSQSVWSMLVKPLQHSRNLALQFAQKIHPPCHTCEREDLPNSCTNQWEKKIEENVCDDDAKWGERSLVFIQVIEGEVTCLLGFMSLHDDVADLKNLHVWA